MPWNARMCEVALDFAGARTSLLAVFAAVRKDLNTVTRPVFVFVIIFLRSTNSRLLQCGERVYTSMFLRMLFIFPPKSTFVRAANDMPVKQSSRRSDCVVPGHMNSFTDNVLRWTSFGSLHITFGLFYLLYFDPQFCHSPNELVKCNCLQFLRIIIELQKNLRPNWRSKLGGAPLQRRILNFKASRVTWGCGI